MSQNLQDWSDEELLCRALTAEDGDPSADAEICRRWGVEATDLLADYFTASHASPADRGQMAHDETEMLVQIAKGEHNCGETKGDMTYRGDIGAPGYGQSWQCRCGRRWTKIGNCYYDPTEGPIELTLADVR